MSCWGLGRAPCYNNFGSPSPLLKFHFLAIISYSKAYILCNIVLFDILINKKKTKKGFLQNNVLTLIIINVDRTYCMLMTLININVIAKFLMVAKFLMADLV
jgi:hypothetical protein